MPAGPCRESQSPYLRTVTILLPLIHNRNRFGLRLPVRFGKIIKTLKELQDCFSGFTISLALGWCAEGNTWDLHMRIELDARITPEAESYLTQWNGILANRFQQGVMFCRLSAPVRWM